LATVERGWLQQEAGKFRLTEIGREVAFELFDLGDRLFANIEGIAEPEMKQLLALHNKVCIKIKALPEPAEKTAFELSLRLRRGPNSPLLAQIRRRIIDLLAFRDDVHIAAWMPHTDEGQIWEAFTLIWRQQAGTAAELAEQLSHRSYDETDYTATLDRLVACGWVAQLGKKYVVRTKAARMRQRVEKGTDQLFQAAFEGLNAIEVDTFQNRMEALAVAVTLPESITA
jgi:DNA-binding MarR family transcriptional regulator